MVLRPDSNWLDVFAPPTLEETLRLFDRYPEVKKREELAKYADKLAIITQIKILLADQGIPTRGHVKRHWKTLQGRPDFNAKLLRILRETGIRSIRDKPELHKYKDLLRAK